MADEKIYIVTKNIGIRFYDTFPVVEKVCGATCLKYPVIEQDLLYLNDFSSQRKQLEPKGIVFYSKTGKNGKASDSFPVFFSEESVQKMILSMTMSSSEYSGRSQ